MFGQIFGIRDFFRLDFRGFLEDLWGDFCRIFGRGFNTFFTQFWIFFGRILEEF